jgi:predicted Zn-ribbon and HTH transcriptional regulator
MTKETLDLLISQESRPRCHLCGFRLAESLKEGEQCPNCLEN